MKKIFLILTLIALNCNVLSAQNTKNRNFELCLAIEQTPQSISYASQNNNETDYFPDNVIETDCAGRPPVTQWGIREDWRSMQSDVDTYVSPVCGDTDGDGIPEIFVAKSLVWGSFQGIYRYNGNNRNNPILINTVVGSTFSSSLALAKIRIADVDRYVIFMIGWNDGKIYAYDANSTGGTPLWISSHSVYNGYQTTDPISQPTINLADFNNDGIPEIYNGGRIFDTETGLMLAEVPAGGNIGYQLNQSVNTFSSATIFKLKLNLCLKFVPMMILFYLNTIF
jgi:hypothetical protein